ncbi:unannotated protein [freshwater metagenome]|uniref:Unannotated protein n=1 Tax=freshwater metagenome TaxID=449393 RepID=A0A6J6FSP7_9ZZZZ
MHVRLDVGQRSGRGVDAEFVDVAGKEDGAFGADVQDRCGVENRTGGRPSAHFLPVHVELDGVRTEGQGDVLPHAVLDSVVGVDPPIVVPARRTSECPMPRSVDATKRIGPFLPKEGFESATATRSGLEPRRKRRGCRHVESRIVRGRKVLVDSIERHRIIDTSLTRHGDLGEVEDPRTTRLARIAVTRGATELLHVITTGEALDDLTDGQRRIRAT